MFLIILYKENEKKNWRANRQINPKLNFTITEKQVSQHKLKIFCGMEIWFSV